MSVWIGVPTVLRHILNMDTTKRKEITGNCDMLWLHVVITHNNISDYNMRDAHADGSFLYEIE